MDGRSLLRVLALAIFAVLAALPLERDADACSCASEDEVLVSPDRVDDAPTNSHIRYETRHPPSRPEPGARTVLRVHGGAAVETTTRVTPSGIEFASIELVPREPLAVNTRYELAVERHAQVPPVQVIGTFRTGDQRDTVAPRFDAPSGVQVFGSPNVQISGCASNELRAEVTGVHATDPGRPNAQLLYGVWLADAAGIIDPKKPPTAVLRAAQETLSIGRSSICDPHSFPLPARGVAVVGIAAIDEAGNTSPVRRVSIDTRAARQP